MKNLSANVLAFIYTILLTAFVLLSIGISDLVFKLNVDWGLTIAIAILCNTLSWLLLRYILFKFLYNRIKLIYKTINKRKFGKSGLAQKFNYSADMVSRVQEDVDKWANEQEAQMEKIIEMSNYRKEFVGNVAHELKTPIFNIQGYTLTLLEGGLEDESINKRYLQKIEKNINRMINIVNDLDTITRLEAGQMKPRIKAFDPVELCKETLESLEDFSRKKNIKTEIVKHFEKSVNVVGDREFIRQVFTNLIVNAIHYNNEGGFVKAEFYIMGKNVLIEITDNGVGIPDEDINRVFERFYRVDKSRSLNSGGSGLGLAIVKHIVEAHGQKVNVRSTVGLGTTISFTLKKDG
ncbi:MAG: ATP-binding protein [Bacteroidales bacterium]|nr:ATP-binding protein [Bacteroidales bacterium]